MPDKAPHIYGADLLGGPAFNLADHKGSFVLVAFMGFPWCGPCKTELPHLAALAEEYEADPSVPQVHFVMVNYNQQLGNDGIIAYLKQENITIPFIDDAKYTIMGAYGIEYVPHTKVVLPSGNLCDDYIGMGSAETLLALLQKCGAPAPGSGITYDLKSQPPPVVVVNPAFTGWPFKDPPVPVPFPGPDPKPLSLISRQVLRALALHDAAQSLKPHQARLEVRSAALEAASAGLARLKSLAALERELGRLSGAMPVPGRAKKTESKGRNG
jgi:thiol-disulfide isomerase/thioredoxin